MRNRMRALLIVLLMCPVAFSAQERVSQGSRDLVVVAKGFVELLVKGDFESAVKHFDRTMQSGLPPKKLAQAWQSVIARGGPFRKQRGVRTERVGNYDMVFVTCEFENAAIDIKVVFDREKHIAGLWFEPSRPPVAYRPPPYVKLDSFQEKEVMVGTGEWAVPGTLSIPVGNDPFPAVVLVHGSGPHDRDESIGPNKPFRDLAWGLASRGVAVLRYDKRTKVHGEKLASLKGVLTVKEETIEDALAAVALLRNTERIDAHRIFVLGHSLGGMLIPRIGRLDKGISGFIVMAGTTRPLEDVILQQMSYVFALDGAISDAEKAQLEKIKRQSARVKDPQLSSTVPSQELPLGIPAHYWLDLRGYNPPEAARGLKQPMLILQGARDYQVTEEDFEGWKKALSSRENVRFRVYPRLNHLFMEGEGMSTPAEYDVPRHVAKIVIDDIADWITRQ